MTGEVPDTLPKLLLRNATVRGARPAMREKDFGIWQTWTWSELAQHVLATMPGKSLMDPQEIAEAAVWLCSDAAYGVSGLSMIVDRGGVNR